MSESTAMVVAPETAPLPVFSGVQMGQALKAYRELQAALDAGMPDQIMDLDGKKFRKKAYWKAVAVAFNLRVECVKEERVERGDGFAWLVTYRATAPNGRSADGDGACGSEEKNRGRMRATEHNVRSHAHTRAANRATSNLCGFGEVSAEEADLHDAGPVIEVQAVRQQALPVPPTVPPAKTNGKTEVVTINSDTHPDDARLILKVVPGRSQNGNEYWEVFFNKAVTPQGYKSVKTWRPEVGELAIHACEDQALVDPTVERKGNFFNLEALEVVGHVEQGGRA